MKYRTRVGFTLIELLVVVLVLAVLVGIALPQYQLSVRRTLYAQMQAILHQLVVAQKFHYLTHGTYATDFNQLELPIPLEDNTCRISGGRGGTCRETGKFCLCINGASVAIAFKSDINIAGVSGTPSGYEYLFAKTTINQHNSLAPGLYCREPSKRDRHCKGKAAHQSWFGRWFYRE